MTQILTISAVVVSNRRLEAIEPTINAVLSDADVIEVILVVDGPGAATLGPPLDALDAANPRLRVLRLTSTGGSELARRVGAEAALGEVVWFLDDDAVPLPGCGHGYAVAHQETGADLVLGDFPMEQSGRISPPAILYEEARAAEWQHFETDSNYLLHAFWAGNFSIRRNIILKVPQIDAVFQWASHSDRAFGLECEKLKLRAVLRTELKAVHKYSRTLAAWRVDCRRQGTGTRALHDLYRERLGPIAPNRWSTGLGQVGLTMLKLARRSPLTTPIAQGLGLTTQLAARLGWRGIAINLARILRSVEQQRDASEDDLRRKPRSVVTAAATQADVSLLIVSAGPAELLRTLIHQWRPHVVEIVVIADGEFAPSLSNDIRNLADRCASVSRAFPVESILARAWTLCSRPFVLRVDDDEVPGETLLAELRSLTFDGSLAQAAFSLRWCWPDSSSWIDAYPWAANPQPRLIRNQPGLICFTDAAHVSPQLDAPIRAVSGALYHLRTLDPLEDRRKHVARYAETIRPHLDGTAANLEYLPEEINPLTSPVPCWDKRRIDAVLAIKERRRRSAEGTAAAQPAARYLDAHGPRLRYGGRGAMLRIRRHVRVVHTDARLILELVIANNSLDVLPARADRGPLVSIATRWTPFVARRGEEEVVEGERLPIGEAVPPLRAILVVRSTLVPVPSGRWKVDVDLVEEGVRWLGVGEGMVIEVIEPSSS